MSANLQSRVIRAKKLGLLLMDARQTARRSLEECAATIGVTPERYQAYEDGSIPPSLPEIEALAYYLDIPMEHFWGKVSLSQDSTGHPLPITSRMTHLRQRMIGAQVRQNRLNFNLTLNELSEKTNILEPILNAYENGDEPIPLPELETLAETLKLPMNELFDKHGPVGKWRSEQQSVEEFLDLPQELQEFVSRPVNRPYIELARRLSNLSVEKLRAVAEGLLEITY